MGVKMRNTTAKENAVRLRGLCCPCRHQSCILSNCQRLSSQQVTQYAPEYCLEIQPEISSNLSLVEFVHHSVNLPCSSNLRPFESKACYTLKSIGYAVLKIGTRTYCKLVADNASCSAIFEVARPLAIEPWLPQNTSWEDDFICWRVEVRVDSLSPHLPAAGISPPAQLLPLADLLGCVGPNRILEEGTVGD